MDRQSVGRYQIIEEIGRGGMATVYRAFDPRFKRDVAVKVMTQDLLENPTLRARFEREAQTIANLEHPAIVPVYDFGEEDGRPYLVMRLMTGGTLSDHLQQGPVSIEGAIKILRRIGSALERAHRNGIIHRDLKPSNVMFDSYGDAYLADFGIARLAESAITLTGDSVIGTPAYMSPEQIHGDKEIDGRSDIYALGVICFEMLTGRRPYEDKTPTKVMMKHIIDPVPDIRQANPDLPQGVEEVIKRTMAKAPDERYTTATELTTTLETLASLTATSPAEKIDATAVAASQAGSTVEAVEPETTAGGEVLDETIIGEEPAGEEAGYPETDIQMPPFVNQAEPEPSPATVAQIAEKTVPETEIAAPAFVGATGARPAEPAATAAGRARKRNWILPAVIGGILLVVILAVTGGIFLASRIGATPESGGSPAVVAVEPTAEPASPKPPEPTPRIDPRQEAEAQMEVFYQRVEAEDYEGAMAAINQAIELAPREDWFWHERAWLFELMGDMGAALENISRAITLDPDEAENYVRRATLLRNVGDFEPALKDHRQSIQLNRRAPFNHFELGLTLKEIGDIDGALAAFGRAIELDPEVDSFYIHRGEIYQEIGNLEAALSDFDKAIELEPNFAFAYLVRANTYGRDLGEYEAAFADFERCKELDPGLYWCYFDEGWLRAEVGDPAGAVANFRRYLELVPEFDCPECQEEVSIYIEENG